MRAVGRGHQRGVAKTYAAAPERTRRVSPRTVACPDCGAEPGEPCERTTGSHPVRARLATRADNAAREAAGTLRAVRPGEEAPRVPGAVERPDADPCPECGCRIPLTPLGRRRAHTGDGARFRAGEAQCPGAGWQVT